MSSIKYLIYLRKSTESEDRQQLSIPAQEKELRAVAERLGLAVVGEPIAEAMSAKRPGRPKFSKMLEAIQQGRANGILCWHLDRLSRNPIDGGALIWAIDQGVLAEIVTPSRRYTGASDDKMMMSIDFGIAKKQIDDLSANVKRGKAEAVERGLWPSCPKLGYIRDHRTGAQLPDPDRFELMKDMFRLRRQHVPVAEILRRARDEWKFATPAYGKIGGKELSAGQLYRILGDPFYAGVIRWKGQTYEGTHEPLVSWSDFEDIQKLREKTGSRPKFLDFTYRGLIRCGACGRMATGERHRNRYGYDYLYYRCSRKRKGYNYCPEPALEVEAVERQIIDFLTTLVVPPDVTAFIHEHLSELEDAQAEAERKARARLEDTVRRTEQRLIRLRELALDGVILPDEVATDRERLLEEKRRAEAELAGTKGPRDELESFCLSLSFANRAVLAFQNGTEEERRDLVQAVSLNLFLEAKTLRVTAKNPYPFFQELARISDCRGERT